MKSAKVLALGFFLSVAGLAQADECCPTTVPTEVVPSAEEQAKKVAADKVAADAAQQEHKEVVAADKE